MIKRILLFVLTNLAVIILLGIIITILQVVFGITFDGYLGLLIFAAIIGFGGAFISLLISRWMAKMSFGIKLIDKTNLNSFSEKAVHVYEIVENISKEKNITMPEVGVYESSDANAFATGYSKNKSLVAVSSGLLNNMNEDEIEGVISHEMSHILNGDMVTMTLLQGVINTFVIFVARLIARAIENFMDEQFGLFGYIFVIIILESVLMFLATPIIMAFSRYREYRADEGSASISGNEKMIAALKKLQTLTANKSSDKQDSMATFKISSKDGWISWFASHPPIEQRIKNLEQMS